jgi:hypothetical protein
MRRSTLERAGERSPIGDKVHGAQGDEQGGRDEPGGRDDEGEGAVARSRVSTEGTRAEPGHSIPEPAAGEGAGEPGAQPRPERAREDRSYSRRRRTLRSLRRRRNSKNA